MVAVANEVSRSDSMEIRAAVGREVARQLAAARPAPSVWSTAAEQPEPQPGPSPAEPAADPSVA
eukprot:5577514-Alexandrium_andersonii.AAC.1